MKKLSNIVNLCDRNRLVISYIAFLIGVSISMFLVAPNIHFFNQAESITVTDNDSDDVNRILNDDLNTVTSLEFLARVAYVIPIVSAIVGGVAFIDKRGVKRQEETLRQMKDILFGSGTDVDPGHIGHLKKTVDKLCVSIEKLEKDVQHTRNLFYQKSPKSRKHEFCKDVRIRDPEESEL